MGAKLPSSGQDVHCLKRRVQPETGPSLLPLCPQDPQVTHKDVKEGSFKLVVDDLLLQVLPDACVGLEEGDTNSTAGRTQPPGLPLTSQNGEEVGGGWDLEERL